MRRGEMAARKEEELGREVELRARLAEPDLAAVADDDIGDDLLSLIFTACHPVLSTEARVALTLRLVGSLSTAEIARAFLAKELTVAQRRRWRTSLVFTHVRCVNNQEVNRWPM